MITQETVLKIADLARLEIVSNEVAEASKQLSAILEHFQELNELNTDGVQPLTNPVEIQGRMEEDHVEKCVVTVTANAPDKSGNLFKVPPIV